MIEFTGERFVPTEHGVIRQEHLHRYAWCLPLVEGKDVLDVASGEGYGSAMLASKARSVRGVDISHDAVNHAAERYAALGNLQYLQGSAAAIPLADDSVDTIVLTYTLCTIPDPGAALAQMRRVLKPEGRLLFCEHGAAPDAAVRRWQDRLNGSWRCMGGGCNLNRDVPQLLTKGGFDIVRIDSMYLPGSPRFVGFNCWGEARPAAG